MTRFALIGDVHGHFDDVDAASLDELGYDAILFVGDLGDWAHRRAFDVARAIAKLETRTIVVPGNHDGPSPLGVLREAVGLGPGTFGSARRVVERTRRLGEALRPAELGGYSLHVVGDVSIVVGRPWAMDGRRATFSRALQLAHGIGDLDASSQRLADLVDRAPTPRLVFLAHNGPSGLGSHPGAPFRLKTGRDIGDPDLRHAITHARARGRRVDAVLAGHIHHGARRDWLVRDEDAVVVNAASVPRIRRQQARTTRHHVEVVVDDVVTARAIELLSAAPTKP